MNKVCKKVNSKQKEVRGVDKELSRQIRRCPACKMEIAVTADRCPNCQRDLRNWFRQHPALVLLSLIFLAFVWYGQMAMFREKGSLFFRSENESEACYEEIFVFSNSMPSDSGIFTVTGDKFRIKYDCLGSRCQAFLREYSRARKITTIVDAYKPAKGEKVFLGSGKYYIDSNCTGEYTMIVEDCQ